MSWIPLAKIIDRIRTRKFAWIADSRTKYLNIRIDTRDDHAVLLDRDGHPIATTEEELDAFFDRLNAKAEKKENDYLNIKHLRKFYKGIDE